MRIDFRILGPLEVAIDAETIKLGGPGQRAVLAILLLDANQVMHIDRIVDDLYDDAPPASALTQVQAHVSHLRKLLGGGLGTDGGRSILETHASGYLLRSGSDDIDAGRFEHRTKEAFAALDQGDAETAADALREALAMWRGPALADFAHERFAQSAIARLEEHRLQALERRIEADLMLGRDGDLVGELEELTLEHPLREQLRAHLMLALYRSGRQAEALDVFHGTRRMLGEELGIEASPALRDLAGMVLRQEPSLERPSGKSPARGALSDTKAATEIRNPYKGLQAFGETDAEDFFGREELSRELAERLAVGRLVAVVGPSGSGKSSLVRAGLIPLLRRGREGGSGSWCIAELTPGDQPLEELEAALLRIAVNPPDSLMEQLESDERGLCRAVKRILPADASELLLVVDQLEELFTLVDSDERRSQFLSLLAQTVADARVRVRLVVVLRADFYDRPLRHLHFAELLRSGVFSVPPLSPEEIEAAISGPAAGVGVALERGLLAEIVADVLDQPGALPLLQYALTELFDRREGQLLTRSAYRDVGGVSGALAATAEEVYSEMAEPGQVAARQLFLGLVAVGDGEADTRRPADLLDLASLDVGQEALADCLSVFGAARLLSFDRDPRSGAPTVEIAHEALIVAWERLQSWIETAREDLRAHRRLSLRATEWAEASRDASLLLRGSQLARFEAWAADSDLAQSELERDFLHASLADREATVAAEQLRRAKQLELERRAGNRLRALVAVLGAAAISAAALTVYAFDQNSHSQHQATVANARRLAAASMANLGVDPELGLLLAIRAVQETKVDGAPLPEAVEALHRALAASRVVATIRTPATAALAVSPDGTRIATAGTTSLKQARERQAGSAKAFVWDAATGRKLLSFAGASSPIEDVAFGPDGSRIVTGGYDGTAIVWDARTGKQLFGLPDPATGGGFLGVRFSPNGAVLATADGVGRVRIWDLGGRKLARMIDVGVPLCGVAWSPDSRLVGAGQCGSHNFSSASATRIWDARSGRLVFKTTGKPVGNVLAFSPDGARFVTPTFGGTAEMWLVGRSRPVALLAGHSGQVYAVAYSGDGRLVATGSTDGTARIWNARSGRQLLVLSGAEAPVNSIVFSPDSRRLIASSGDGTVRSWDLTPEGGRDWLTLAAHPGGVDRVTFSADGARLVTTGQCDGRTKTWSARSGALISSYRALPGWSCASGGQFPMPPTETSPDGTVVAQGDGGDTLLMDGSGGVIRTLHGAHQGVETIAFDGTGKLLATGNSDGTTDVWNAESGHRERTFAGHAGVVEKVTFSPDGRTLATVGEDTTAKLWDLRTGRHLLTLTGHTLAVTDVAFSPDGDRLATASKDGTVRVYVLPIDELLAVARQRLTRTWSDAKCRSYLTEEDCRS